MFVTLKHVKSDVQDQINTCLKTQEGVVHLTEDVTVTGSCINKNITTPYKFAGVTPDQLHCLSGVRTNIQPQFYTINAIEGYDENGNAYIFAGATPAEIVTLNGVTHSIQGQFDEVANEFDVINSEID